MDRNELNKQWHQGFYSAARLELNADRDNLHFDEEYYLSHEPIRIDLLMIKKLKDVPVQNDIGHIFRKYNICEYKSPEDGLNIDDYYKTIGYACMYKGLAETVNEVPADEITVTLVREGYPEKLISQLESSGCIIREYVAGIYYVEGNTLFPVQIVVTGRLGDGHHWLRALTQKITEKDIKDFTDATGFMLEQGQKNYIDAIYQISVLANMEAYENFKRRYPEVCESLKILMKPEFDEATEKAMQQGMQQGIQQGIQQGMQQGKNDLFTIIMRVKEGATESLLLEEGYSIEDIKLAIKALR